jgi:hypothetical protein
MTNPVIPANDADFPSSNVVQAPSVPKRKSVTLAIAENIHSTPKTIPARTLHLAAPICPTLRTMPWDWRHPRIPSS